MSFPWGLLGATDEAGLVIDLHVQVPQLRWQRGNVLPHHLAHAQRCVGTVTKGMREQGTASPSEGSLNWKIDSRAEEATMFNMRRTSKRTTIYNNDLLMKELLTNPQRQALMHSIITSALGGGIGRIITLADMATWCRYIFSHIVRHGQFMQKKHGVDAEELRFNASLVLPHGSPHKGTWVWGSHPLQSWRVVLTASLCAFMSFCLL